MDFTPRIIFWEITKQCNLQCGFCRVLGSDSSFELTTSQAFGVVREIKNAFFAGGVPGKTGSGPILVLSGGEPLLRKDIFEILKVARDFGITTALATNGVLLGESEVRMLKNVNISRVSLSFDSVDQAIHDVSRGVKGAFGKTIEAAQILQRSGIPFQLNHTVTKANKNNIRAIAEFALRLGAVAVHYFILVPVGCAKLMQKEALLSAEDNEEILGVIKEISGQLPLEICPTCAPQYVRFTDSSAHKASDSHAPGQRRFSGCLAGTAAFFISAQADICPCGYLPVKAGSLRTHTMKDIWNDSAVFKELRQNNLKDGCANCYVKDTCRGCRARAFSNRGDYMAGDTTCVLAKEAIAL